MEERKTIVGEKVLLRPITREDTPRIVRWRNTPSVRENFIFRETFTEEMHEHWLDTKVASGEVIQYIIVDKSENKPVGSIYFRDVNRKNRSAEYGLFIGEESARGKGLGKEAIRLFTDFGFEEIGLHRISMRVLSDNDASIITNEKVGFMREGVFRDMEYLDGQYRDVIFMAKINQERET